MWINRNTDPFTKIVIPIPMRIGNEDVGELFFTNSTEEELNAKGIYTIVKTGGHDNRYYESIAVEDFVSTPPTISYTKTDLLLVIVQNRMIADLFAHADKLEESYEVESTLGFNVRGSHNDLMSFEVGSKRGFTKGRDINGVERSLSPSDYNTIITAIEDKGKEIFDTRWLKFDEINALVSVADCVAYEAIPNNVTGW